MPEISQEELDALRAAAAAGQPQDTPAEEDTPPAPTHVALLADGRRFEYAGAHPTHVTFSGEDHPVPVTGVYPLT